MTPSAKLIFSHKETLAQYAAMQIAELSQLFVARRGYFTIALSGGSTPQMLYELLATPNISAQIPWKRTHIFWADERAVSPEEDGSQF